MALTNCKECGAQVSTQAKIVQVVEQKLKTLLIKMDLSRICYSIYYWHYCWWWRGIFFIK